MYKIIDRPYSVSFNNGLYYSKRKLFDEPSIQYDQTNTAGYYGFIQSPSFHGIEQSNHILNTHNFNFQKQQQQYSKSKYNDNRQQQQQHQHAKPTEQRNLASPDSGRNSHKQRFSPNSQRLVLVEDMQPRTKLTRQNDHHNTSNDNQLVNSKGNKSPADQHPQQVNSNLKLNRKFPTFNNSSMLNSLADYNLTSLDDKMFNLTIDYSRNDIKNMSLDSLTNVRVKMANKSSPPKDEFAAYRLNEVDSKADMGNWFSRTI